MTEIWKNIDRENDRSLQKNVVAHDARQTENASMQVLHLHIGKSLADIVSLKYIAE